MNEDCSSASGTHQPATKLPKKKPVPTQSGTPHTAGTLSMYRSLPAFLLIRPVLNSGIFLDRLPSASI